MLSDNYENPFITFLMHSIDISSALNHYFFLTSYRQKLFHFLLLHIHIPHFMNTIRVLTSGRIACGAYLAEVEENHFRKNGNNVQVWKKWKWTDVSALGHRPREILNAKYLYLFISVLYRASLFLKTSK